MSERDEDRYARELGHSPHEIEVRIKAFEEDVVLRYVIADRVQRLTNELRTTLETITPERLAETQGRLKGIKQAHGAILRIKQP